MTCSQNDFTAGPMAAIMFAKPSRSSVDGIELPRSCRLAAGAKANKQLGWRGLAAPSRHIVP
ncbi:hypothetical protein C5L14_28795 [Labrys okinawensis]|uniref:Uncharacterized protein n=1 Tax=Labrys okinawensis TaxID=346911 RepID=A0A2S9Q3Y6_9HYPH|nr:hypothetical protein [Labrys okinawensis]PRH84076.1 hypothetical protein C5L14_28795 [Labrys okinawensis]